MGNVGVIILSFENSFDNFKALHVSNCSAAESDLKELCPFRVLFQLLEGQYFISEEIGPLFLATVLALIEKQIIYVLSLADITGFPDLMMKFLYVTTVVFVSRSNFPVIL